MRLSVGKYVALVDDADAHLVASSRKWWPVESGGRVYAIGYVGGKNVYLHRFLMRAPKGMDVDHINGDGLDNRRENLRLCSRSQNLMNRGKTRANKSGYKGVKRVGSSFQAYLKSRYLGTFSTAEEASRAYMRSASELYGEYVKL